MKRHLVIFSLAFFLVIFLSVHEFDNIIKGYLALAIISLVSSWAFYKKDKIYLKNALLICFASSLALSYFNLYTALFIDPLKLLSDRTYNLQVTLSEYPIFYEDTARAEIFISDDKLDINFTTLCYFDDLPLDAKVGDKITGWFSFYKPTSNDGFDRSEYYDSKGVFISASCRELESYEAVESVPLRYLPQNLAKNIKDNLSEILNDDYIGLANSVLFGDKTNISEEIYDKMQQIGITHIIAVSGMHISFIVSCILIIFGKNLGKFIGVIVIFLFVPMVGMTPSAMRAGIMYLIVCLAWFYNREADSKTSLAVALFILILLNPYSVNSISLQLSFLATLGILTISSKLEQYIKQKNITNNKLKQKIISFFSTSFSCSIGAIIFTTPIIMVEFGYIAMFSPLANLVAIPLVSHIFPLTALAGIIYEFVPFIGHLLAELIEFFMDLLIFWVDIIAKIPFNGLYTDNELAYIFVIVIYGLFMVSFLLRKHKLSKMMFVLVTIGMVLIVIPLSNYNKDKLKIVVFPSGSAQTIMLTQNDRAVLIDCSSSGQTRDVIADVKDYMKRWSLDKIDLVMLTSIDKSHANEIPNLIDKIEFDYIIAPENFRETDFTDELFEILQENEIEFSTIGQVQEILSHFKLDVNDDIDRKFAIFGNYDDKDVLFAGALTQNMLLELSDGYEINCDLFISAQNIFEFNEKLDEILIKTTPNEIIINSYTQNIPEIDGIDIKSPIIEGNIEIIIEETDNGK